MDSVICDNAKNLQAERKKEGMKRMKESRKLNEKIILAGKGLSNAFSKNGCIFMHFLKMHAFMQIRWKMHTFYAN